MTGSKGPAFGQVLPYFTLRLEIYNIIKSFSSIENSTFAQF